jgi:hypothetical protein
MTQPGAASGLLQRFVLNKELGLAADEMLRLLFLECRANLAILEVVDMEQRQADEDQEPLSGAAAILETEILERCLLAGKSNREIFRKIRKVDSQDPLAEDETPAGGSAVASRLLNLYTAVSALQRISSGKVKAGAIRKIRYKNLLRNVRASLLAVLPGLRAAADMD